MRGKSYMVEGVKILVTSFHLTWVGADDKVIIGICGLVSYQEQGLRWSTKFDLSTGLKSKLTFENALAYQTEGNPDPVAIALTVKRVLIQFVRECPLIPVEFREQAAQTILKQHEQGKS